MKSKAKKLTSKALSLLLVLTMLIGTFPAAGLTALAAGVPDSLVTSLAQLYEGDEDRARADLEAMYAAELLDDDGKLVDLDIREDGESVELDELAERITNGETVGEITVNGNEATPEQIAKISQVKAALEIAALLDEEIDVTDEHVNNLESLLTGIQNGSIDLNDAIKTGSLKLNANQDVRLLSNDDSSNMPATNTGTGNVEVTEGKYTAPYISDGEYEDSHSFTLADPSNTTWYTESVVPSDGSNYHINEAIWLYLHKYGQSELTNGTTIPRYANYTPNGIMCITVLDVNTWDLATDVTFDRTVSDAVTLDDPANQFGGSPYSGTITYKAGTAYSPTNQTLVIYSNLKKDNNNLWSGTQCIVVNANNIKNATFPGGKKTWNSIVYYERGDNVAVTQLDSLAAESISVTAGTYCPENVVPITVTLAGYATAPEGTTLKVNGRDCPMLNTAGTKARKFTFGYTLNEVDAAMLNITELTGLVNASGNPITVNEGIQKSIGREQGVILSTPFKTNSIDLDSVKYGIDDAGRQTVTVLFPFKSDAQKTWVTNDMETINPAVTMSFPGYENASVGGYLKNAYFSMDGGATRYPVYVIDEADALAVRFVPPNNVYDALRKDTITLFLDDNSETNYLGTWADKQTDSGGFAYFAATENSAPAVSGRSYSYYVKSSIAFDKNETTDRQGYIEANVMKDESGKPLGFYKDGGKYVAVQDDNYDKQHDVELVANEELYNAVTNGVRAEDAGDLLLNYQCSNRKNFTFTAPECFSYSTSDPEIAEVVKDEETGVGHIVLTGAGGEVTITVTVGNGSDEKKYDLNLTLKLLEGKTPFLNIPSLSQERMGLTGKDVDVMFASNVTARNAAVGKNTTFNAKLYEVSAVGDTPTGNAVWSGDFESTIENTLTHITVPARETPGIYAVVISTKYEGGEADGVMTEAKDFSATAYLNVKQAPVKVTLDKLERYSAAVGEIPAITYKVNSQNAKVEYTVQKSGEAVSARTEVTGGTIPFEPTPPAGLKEAYTITVYARNPGDEAWSTDSMMFTVYNGNALDVIVSDVEDGAIGGTTGGNGEGAKGTTINMDNHGKLEKYGITDGDKYQLNVTDLDALRTDMSLQKVISANYGSGAWGLLSDKMQWKSGDSSKVSVNYEQSGIYSDINSYSYTSYGPATDFLLVSKDDTDGVDIEVTHTATGKKASVKVTADTLKDQLYIFRFNPQVETDVIYTNGADEKRTLKSDENGMLAVYEPEGFKGDIMVMSVKDSDTYVATINSKELQSGERDIALLQMYPCNNLTLRKVSDCTLTFLKPDGKPYTGKVILRGGVYAGDEYCPEAKIRTEKNISSHQYLREDIEFTTNADGKTTVYFDPTQFTSESGKTWVNGLKYVFEYRFENSYQPGYVIVNSSLNNPAESIVNLKSIRGSGKVPTIVRQEYKQFLNGTTPTNYTRNVIDYKDNIGISPNFPKAELYTDIVVLGETVGTDEKGYSSISGANALSFALCVSGGENDGKSLTGQTDLSEGKTITKLSDLNNANFFVFPFSAVPMLRSTYTMTNENLKADGIDDTAKTPTARIKAVFRRGGLTVRSMNMPFGVTNVSNQPNLTSSTAGAAAVGKEVRENLRETTDIGAIFRSINVNDMIRKGFVFLGNLAGAGGNNPVNLMILPTQDPATFRIIAFIGANQRGGEDVGDGVSVNFNAQDLAEDMTKFKKEMEELNKKKDDENDSGGESSMKFNFYGTIILEAHAGVTDGKWDIAFRGGNVGTNVKGKYEWGQTFFCGPYPAFISFETGFHADLEVAFGNKAAARAMLLDAALGVSVEAFAGLGFDLSIVALQLGIYGRIGADVNFLLLTPSDASNMNGTKLTIDGEIGLKLKVKLLFISYSKKFASTGFNWTKKWNNYDKIKKYWTDQGYAELFGTTKSGRAYTMLLFKDGSTMVAIEGGAELENRDYLELANRAWKSGKTGIVRLFSAAEVTDAITDVQTNSYPHSHPAFTDDGEMFLYISDNDNAKKVESVASYAVKNDNGYANKERVDTSSNNVLADLDVVASGTKENAFAAWVKQVETPKMEKNVEVTNDELGMMFNATEIYAGSYNGTDWTTTRLTDNSVADMAPTVASSGNKAIVAWRSMNASSMSANGTDVEDITAMFDVENNINYRIYDGSEWKTAKVAYNGNMGTVNAIDSAMLDDGTAILTYTVRTGEDVASTETFYTVIGADGNVITNGRLTNDSYTDTNAQVTAVNDTNGKYFVLGWYSEHDAGEGMTSEYDAEGNATQKAVVAHDIRLARINANGSYDIDFPESIGGTGDKGISSDFRFSAPANNSSIDNVSVVWSQRKDSNEADDAGKYELCAVRFFKANNVTGLTSPTDIAETDKNYTIDRFDTYTDNTGAIHAIILGSDYNSIKGIEKYDSIDLDKVTKELGENESNSDSPNNLDILDGEAISSLKLATGIFPAMLADVTADVNISEVIPGFTTPVQFTVTNKGTSVLDSIKVTVGDQSKDFTGLNLLPNQSATLLMSYNVPEGAVSDADYTVKSGNTELGKGTLTLNRPDVGISGIKLLQENEGMRDIQLMLANNSEIPLAGSKKTVKLAFYKDPFHESMIGNEVSISSDALVDIDADSYTTVQTVNVTDLYEGDGEIPDEGLTVYAHAWVEDTDEPDIYNNDNYISFKGLLTRNNGEKLTTDTTIEENEGDYTVYADIRNNSMKETNVGIPVALLLDSNGEVIAQKNFQDKSLSLTKEQRKELSVAFTADDIGDKTPARAVVDSVCTVTFDLNGGSGDKIDPVQTDLDGHITLPETQPTPPTGGAEELFFAGWYTAADGGDKVTAESTFKADTTVYAHYVTHRHKFTYSADGSTITATCSADDCTLPEVDGKHVDTLTVARPTLTKYGEIGKSAEATLNGSIDGITNPNVEYWNGDDKLESAPTEPGIYTASITLGEGEDAATAQVQYTIDKRNVTLTSATKERQYNGNALTDNTVTVSGDGWATGEGATYTVTGSQKVVGTTDNTFTYKLNDNTKADNYIITTSTGTLTVTNRTAKYEISPQANSSEIKYDGTEKSVSGLKTETFTVDGNTYTVSGLTATGSGTDAGSYTVSVSGTAVVRDSDGNDVTSEFSVTPLTGTLTIGKREVTLTSATAAKEYDGSALTNNNVTVTGDGFVEGEGATYNVTGAQTLVGTSDNIFTFNLNDNTKADNYTIITNNGTLTVNDRNTKYSVTLKADSGEFKYDGSEKNVTGWTINNVAGGGFTAENGLAYTVTGMTATLTQTDAGSYDVTVTGTPVVRDNAGNDVTKQFAVSVEKGTLTINKRNVTLTSATDSKAYDGTALTNDTVTVSGDGWASGEGASYTVTGSQTLPESSANAFNYTLSSGTKAKNYDITKVEGTLTITNRNDTEPDKKYDITVKANSDTVTYDGKAHTVSGFETLEYTVGGVKYTVSGLTATATETNAGTYTVPVTGTAVVKDTNGNDLTAQFNVKTENGSLTINKTAISGAIVGMGASKYDEAVSEPAIVSDGREGSNGAVVGDDTTKKVTYYYQNTAFLKSQTDDISALDTAEGVYKTIIPTTFEPGTHYVLAVITGDNYNNAPYITQSAFEVTQNTETVRTAPEAPTVDGTKVTVAEADREKSLEYSLDGETWLPAELNENGEFNAQWANPVTDAELKLRETDDESYAKPSANATGTAKITTTTFTVSYDANGGVKAPEAATASADRTVNVSGQASMTRKGYTFTEWNTNADGSGTAYKAGDTLDTGLTLYAQWEANTYKVHFNANGGTGTMEELEFTYDVENTLTENAFSRDEYVFLGWSQATNGSLQYQDQQSVKNIAENGTVTLYAVWAKDLYNINGKIKSVKTGDITLELVQGNNTFIEPKTVSYSTANEDTEFALNGVPTGNYNLIAKQGDLTMTVVVNITEEHVDLGTITMPIGNTSSVANIKGDNVPAIVIGGLNDIAAAEEIDGRKITVTIEAETQNEEQVGEAGEAILRDSFAQNAEFFDFTVTKTITNDDTVESIETMTETKSLVEFVIPFDFSRKSAVKVYRYHDGAPEALTEADTGEEGTYRLDRTNGLIYVYAAKFSTYAIVYSNSRSGGGISLATDNTVTVEKADNGSVSVSPTNATSGKTVTITVTPDKGYKLGSLTVTDQTGKDIAVTEKDGKYTFTMPDGKVMITPVFVKEGGETPPADNENTFIDVKTGDYFYDAVLWAAKEGVTSGTTDTTFSPNESCTRGQTVTFLWRVAGSPEPTIAVNPFTDVKTGDYFYKAVLWAYENGITKGTSDTEFSPSVPVTRGQTVTFLYRLTGDKAKGKNPFTDVKTGDYFYDAVLWAAKENITSGTSDTAFSPNDNCLRGQIVTFLYRYYK